MARPVNVVCPRDRDALATLYDPVLIAMSPFASRYLDSSGSANKTLRRLGWCDSRDDSERAPPAGADRGRLSQLD